MFNPKRILVTTDFSGESDLALREALEISRKYKSRIYLMHVLPDVPLCFADYCVDAREVAAEKATLRKEAVMRMKDEVARIVGRNKTPLTLDVRFGDTADEIIRQEKAWNIDLVVAAPHPRKKHRWTLLPRLSETLVRRSPAETLVVKAAAR